MNRRKFFGSSAKIVAGAIGFPYLVPSSVFGSSGSVPPSDRILMGCIGLGGQGTYNMQAFMNMPDVQIVALCDVNKGSSDYDMLYQFDGTTAGLNSAFKRLNTYIYVNMKRELRN